MYVVVQNLNSKHFCSNTLPFQITLQLELIAVTLQLYIVKRSKFKEERRPPKRP